MREGERCQLEMVGLTATHIMADMTSLKRGSGGCVPTIGGSRSPASLGRSSRVPERGIRPMVKPRTRWRDHVSLMLGAPQNTPGGAEEESGEREVRASLLRPPPRDPVPDKAEADQTEL